MPLTAPELLKNNPGGKEPLAKEKVNAELPVAWIWALYELEVVAEGREKLVKVGLTPLAVPVTTTWMVLSWVVSVPARVGCTVRVAVWEPLMLFPATTIIWPLEFTETLATLGLELETLRSPWAEAKPLTVEVTVALWLGAKDKLVLESTKFASWFSTPLLGATVTAIVWSSLGSVPKEVG